MSDEAPGALMVFAAGLGTRMGALTAARPKPLLEVGGRTLLDHALALAQGEALRTVVNVHYHAGQIEAHLAGRGIALSDERAARLETGGGLRAALPLLGPGPVLTLNSDAVWTGPSPIPRLRAAWRPGTMGALLLLVPQDRATGYRGAGDFEIPGAGAGTGPARLRRGPGHVYTGLQVIDPAGLAAIPEAAFSLNRLWDAMAAEGRLWGLVHDGGWCDVGRPECLPLAEALLADA